MKLQTILEAPFTPRIGVIKKRTKRCNICGGLILPGEEFAVLNGKSFHNPKCWLKYISEIRYKEMVRDRIARDSFPAPSGNTSLRGGSWSSKMQRNRRLD